MSYYQTYLLTEGQTFSIKFDQMYKNSFDVKTFNIYINSIKTNGSIDKNKVYEYLLTSQTNFESITDIFFG